MPERIQLSRTKGWRKPEGAIVASRPSKWGNPFVVGGTYFLVVEGGPVRKLVADRAQAVSIFRSGFLRLVSHQRPMWLGMDHYPVGDIEQLRGRDLGCWCPLDEPCHCDVLLEVANR